MNILVKEREVRRFVDEIVHEIDDEIVDEEESIKGCG